MTQLDTNRQTMRQTILADDAAVLALVRGTTRFDDALRTSTHTRAVGLAKGTRNDSHPGLMEVFLAGYGLCTEKDVALMRLAEALLRVPDAETIDTLIEEKIASGEWGTHLGHSSSSMLNVATWGRC